MKSTEENPTQAELPTRISNYKLHAFLQNDALTERITSELEQLNYAQILTSLATGSSDLLNRPTFQFEEQTLNNANAEQQSDFSHRQKRRVKPSRKIRELQEINDVKRHGSYANEFRREKDMKDKRKIVRKNNRKKCLIKREALSGNGLEKRITKDRKTKIHSEERFLRKRKKYGVINSEESLDRNEVGCVENGNELGGTDKEEENYTEVKSRKLKEAMYNRGNRDTRIEENYSESMHVKSRNSKENNEDGRSDEKSRYQCEQCGKCFKTYYTFSIHIRMPEHTKETPFVCDVCGKGFRLSSTLCRHKIIHTSNKPHECKICRKTFNRSSTLKMHMRTHSARKQHVCSTCGKGFHQKGNLRNHMFVHSGERPFCCEMCGRHFNKKSNLKHHLKIHEMNGKYSCTICKKVFEEHAGLKDHMQTKHVHLRVQVLV